MRAVFTDPLPLAEVERVEANEEITGVEWGMEALAAVLVPALELDLVRADDFAPTQRERRAG